MSRRRSISTHPLLIYDTDCSCKLKKFICMSTGNELIDDYVDIGENDLPVSTLPPVVFEVETADRSSKHSTSSSSSSDSESSSSGMQFHKLYPKFPFLTTMILEPAKCFCHKLLLAFRPRFICMLHDAIGDRIDGLIIKAH